MCWICHFCHAICACVFLCGCLAINLRNEGAQFEKKKFNLCILSGHSRVESSIKTNRFLDSTSCQLPLILLSVLTFFLLFIVENKQTSLRIRLFFVDYSHELRISLIKFTNLGVIIFSLKPFQRFSSFIVCEASTIFILKRVRSEENIFLFFILLSTIALFWASLSWDEEKASDPIITLWVKHPAASSRCGILDFTLETFNFLFSLSSSFFPLDCQNLKMMIRRKLELSWSVNRHRHLSNFLTQVCEKSCAIWVRWELRLNTEGKVSKVKRR